MHVCMHAYNVSRIHAYMCVYIYIYIYITNTDNCKRIHIHINIHIHIHKHIHTCTQTAAEMERGIVRRRMEGWYAEAVASSEPARSADGNGAASETHNKETSSHSHNKAVDFSPVLQALQAKLASLTQENITLRETVKELEQAMGAVEEQYQQRLKEALAHVSMDRREHVRNVIQSIRVKERQERAMYRHLTSERLHEQVDTLCVGDACPVSVRG
jgi:hypothetical protein